MSYDPYLPVFPLLPLFLLSRSSSSALLSLQIRSSRFRLFAPLVPRESITATDPPLPNPGDIPSFQNRLTLTTSSSSTSSTVSLTSTSAPSKTHTSSSTTEPATVLSTSPLAFAPAPSIHPMAPDVTSWRPTAIPSPTFDCGRPPATSTNYVRKTLGVPVCYYPDWPHDTPRRVLRTMDRICQRPLPLSRPKSSWR